ncbi:hypothetical protein [Streptomyces sp. NPDC047928]|uniref:hypothetical protein n=1 Tax=Streptomyces sp. NPDC047928 TaxID=3365492 RepID=UPI003712BD98
MQLAVVSELVVFVVQVMGTGAACAGVTIAKDAVSEAAATERTALFLILDV